jgi:ABC-2 type transport system permease protein
MRKTLIVALREYIVSVRTKAFLIGLLMMPLMMGGSFIVGALMQGRVDTKDKRIAVADYTGRLFDGLDAAARQRNEVAIFTGEGAARKQTLPRFVLEKVDTGGAGGAGSLDMQRLSLKLSDRIRKGELMAFVLIGPNVIDTARNPGQATLNYYSNTPTYNDVLGWISGVLNEQIQQLRLEGAAFDPKVVRQLTQRVPVGNLGLVKTDAAGNITSAVETNQLANFLVPFAMMFLMFMVIMASTAPLLNSTLEEKTQRIAEVLLASIPPFELMAGKLLGILGVSLTMATVYLGGAYAALNRAGYVQFFPWQSIGWFVGFLSLAVLMYGSIFIAIGAAVSDMKEAQSMMTPVMLLVVSPMFVLQYVMREPASTLSLVMSLFPPATPMLMTIRQTVPPGIPVWQPLLGVALVLLTSLACVFAAGRIFRVGILMQGKGAKISEMFRWALRG